MPFAPGNSGNPGGKARGPTDAKVSARELTKDAFRALKAALKRPGERVQAANVILAYGYGKPATSVNLRVIRSVEDLSEEELRVLAGETEGQLLIEAEAEADDTTPQDDDDTA
jgi:hypothetical protein